MKTLFKKSLCSIACLALLHFADAQKIKPAVIQPTQPPATPGPISGPTSVQAGQTAAYSVAAVSGASSYSWALSSTAAGTISGTGTSATVNWSSSYSGSAQVYCSSVNSYGSSSPSILSVNVTANAPVVPGNVSPASQTITYNSAPATISTTPATGGNGVYAYQWQSSVNNVSWTSISGATGLSYSPGALAANTWYQVIVTSNGASVNSSPAAVIINQATNPANVDTTFNSAMNNVFGNLDNTKIPFGMLRDYAMELTNLENFDGTALTDSNKTDAAILRDIYTTLATSRMTSGAVASLPNPDTIDSLWYTARQQGQVTLSGLFYQYSYLDPNGANNGKITITNGQLFDKYINGVWQNPYLQAQVVAFAPAAPTFNALNFNIVLPADLWLTNSASLVSSIQIDAGDGLGYRTLTPGTPLPVMYADTGLKTWNFKVVLTNNTVLQSHAMITVSGVVNNLTCFTPGCGPYTPPGGGGGGGYNSLATKSMAIQTSAAFVPGDVISGSYPYYFFQTGAKFNGKSAIGVVNIQYASGGSSITNPLIVVEGFDERYYTAPESYPWLNSVSDFLKHNVDNSPTLAQLITSKFDIIYVTFLNGTDDIHRNALLVESVIRWVNANKTGTSKNAIIGLSMGGLCTRYALKQMEANVETHQVGLFVCHGSPQQGVDVPIGLQYLETHANSLYFRSGVKPIYQVYRLFAPSRPKLDGVLTLSNTPAAEQMLITHINSNFQIDNSAHINWENELNQLGYPSQGNIRNVAISNGSECGQGQIISQGGPLLYLNAKLNTSFLGDLISMIAGVIGIPEGLSGQQAFFLSVIPGRNDISLNFQANAAVDGGGNQAYFGKISYKKTILWVIPLTVTITNRSFNHPSGVFPYGTFAGDYEPLPNMKSFNSGGWFGKYNVTLNIAPSFGFVPTVSALDIGSGSAPLLESDYSVPYGELSPPQAPKSTPFLNFITAYSPTTPTGNNNEEHITYEPRNGDWLVNELKAQTPNVADCSSLCAINAISGPAYNCNRVTTYTVPTYNNVSYTWVPDANIQLVSQNGTSTMQIQPVAGSNGTSATLSLNMSIIGQPDCMTQTITTTITLGVEPLVVNSTVDRSQQQSGYQYLTATATQLPGTVSSNYTWYLLDANRQPTTVIGYGLQLVNYPIPPGTTIYYECQAVTPCGTSVYNGYAYNTNSGGYATVNQSVVIYPNPANSSMTVTNNSVPATTDASGNPNGNVPQSYEVKVYNDKGKILKSAHNEHGAPDVTISTADMPDGNYFLHIIQGNSVIEKQMMVRH